MLPDENKRKLKRRHLIYYLKVFDQITGQLMGHLVDITPEGIMLVSEKKIEINKSFNLRMELPAEILMQEEILFEATSLWCKKDINPDFYATGFRTILAEIGDLNLVERLVNRYGFHD
jgi:hypothetical protein